MNLPKLPDPRSVVKAYRAEIEKVAAQREEIAMLGERAATLKLLISLGAANELIQFIAAGKHRT